MDEPTIHILGWLLGAAGAVLAFVVGIWWRVEQRQDHKIDTLSSTNGKEHRDLHDKIDSNHHAIRDRLDNIWKHMKPPID